MENLSPVLAKRLKDLRESRGLTLAALSKALTEQYGIQISKESLTNYEVATVNHTKAKKNEGMSVKYLRCLADFYYVSTDYLLGITDIPNTDMAIQGIHKLTGLSVGAICKLNEMLQGNPKTAFCDIVSLLIDDSNAEYFLAVIAELISYSFDNSGEEIILVPGTDMKMPKEKLLKTTLQINLIENLARISDAYKQEFQKSPAERNREE